VEVYTPFTRSSKHRTNIEQTSSRHQANVKQTSSKYEACIKHSLHKANIKQTSSKHRASSSSQLHRVNGILTSGSTHDRLRVGYFKDALSRQCTHRQKLVSLIKKHEIWPLQENQTNKTQNIDSKPKIVKTVHYKRVYVTVITVLLILPVILQTVINLRMLSIGGQEKVILTIMYKHL